MRFGKSSYESMARGACWMSPSGVADMTRAITGLQAIFDEGLMKRTFEDYLLPFCGGGTVIRECRRGWSKYRPDKGTSQAVYHVDFADPNEREHFRRLLYLIVPGETRLEPGMPDQGQPEEKDV